MPKHTKQKEKEPGIPEHTHCLYCGKPVEFGKPFCSTECEKGYRDLIRKRRRRALISEVIPVVIIVLLVLLLIFRR